MTEKVETMSRRIQAWGRVNRVGNVQQPTIYDLKSATELNPRETAEMAHVERLADTVVENAEAPSSPAFRM